VPESPRATSDAPDLVGGRYALRGEIGRGGMATVHRARDEVLQREVAVKLLHAHLAGDETFLDRFRREARAAAAVHHPNVVTVHDWGETADGAYLVLQLVEGCSLREVLRRRQRLTPGETLAVLGPAGDGLGAAHVAGLVHRDVKPENVLLATEGGVLITDFGLARAAASATSTFGADVLMGTPHYLSPEAVRNEPLSPPADVYALGVVLYECLTGRPPHEGDSPFATAVAHTSRRVPAPSEVEPTVDAAVDEVVLRATAPDPRERYPDGAAFSAALRAAVPAGPQPVPSPGDSHVPGTSETLFGGSTRGSAVLHGDGDDAPTVVANGDGPPPAPALLLPDDEDLESEEHDEDGQPGRPRRRRRGWLVALLILGLLLASGAGGYLLWDRVLAPVTAIPPVVGADEQAATAQLEELGFEVAVATERPHDLTVPEGHVLDQSPTGEARAGSVVTLTLSAGPRPVEVPAVEGLEREEAVGTIEDADLAVEVAEEHHEEVAEGLVVRQSPAAEEVVDEGTSVELVVSMGPEPIEVPDLRGESVSTARSQLEELGLGLEIGDRRYDDDLPADAILGQDVDAGTTLVRGDTVEVVVSDGPEPIEVPNVRDEHVEDAVATLEALGFEVEVERRGGLGALFNPGRVVDQNPGPGARRQPGDTVTVYAYED
jgi:eukaryotic-like serine/threonine-protein kinase